ncbi:flagellar biosynthetic protein FliR [bacterium]|nr:flagellar biosynthetic protein FliR [bacterium]
MTLEGLLIGEIFSIMLVFCRIGTAIMFMPGIGEMYVPLRVRLLLSLTISYLLAPILKPYLPPVATSTMQLFMQVSTEIMYGFFIGMATKTLLATMHIAGMVIATHTNFATAMLFDSTQGSQSASLGVLLTLTSLLILLVTDTHLLVLQAFVDSYTMLKPTGAVPWHDMAVYFTRLVALSFMLALSLSMPFIVSAMVINIAAGVLSRLMPNFQVFFVMMPAQIIFGLLVMAAVLPDIMLWFHQHFREQMENFLSF